MGTQHQGPAHEVQALDAYIKLMRASESVTTRLNRLLAAHELTVSQFGTLEALLHLGPLSQSEIAKKILKSSGNITMVVDNLEKRRLARREREASDRRCVKVYLTEEGQALIRSIFPGHVAAIVKELSVLSGPEQEVLGRLCRRLGRQLSGAGP